MRKHAINVVSVVLAGVLMSAGSPAVAQDEPSRSGGPAAVSISDLRASQFASYRLRNFKSQKVLQPVSSSNGSQVVQQPFASSILQLWQLVNDGGYTTLWNLAPPGLNMGIDRASTAPGAVAIVAHGSAHFNQDFLEIWRTETEFNLKNRHSGLCLGIDGASTANGARAMQFPCNPTALNQNWQFV